MFENLLNPLFAPLLLLPPWLSIAILSLLVSLIITLIYRAMTDQNLMKQLKDEMKEFQKEMKELKAHPEKAMAVQKKAMETNMKYMSHSMRPMLITFIPIIVIFGWMNAHLAYEPILPGEEFTTTTIFQKDVTGEVKLIVPEGVELLSDSKQKIGAGQATWTLKGEAGNYLLEFIFDNQSYTKDLLITKEKAYAKVQQPIPRSKLRMIKINNEPVIAINLFGKDVGGWTSGRFGWLGAYILFSLIFSMTLRKILKVY
jgi:uncharacterized membrane protein (DUF106 family)